MAARSKCPQSVRYLLDKKADAHTLDDNGRSPLYYAMTQDDLPTEIFWAVDFAAFTVFEYLLGLSRRTADASDISEPNLLHDAAAGASVKIFDLLLRSGVDVNLEWQGSSALHVAAENGRVENIRKLLVYKAKVDAPDYSKKTPLHSAAAADQAEAVKALLEAGSQINAQDNDLRIPVYVAAYYGQTKSLETLLQYKPDLSIVHSSGWTPLHVGVDNLEVTKLLVGDGASPNRTSGLLCT
ncbi:hypothetical protein QQZ08_009498 [Neonectria magnoliae]|uniref:Uncharacterized protein n=1 Tax=Neonectria magnoliae TaxID=2732573 RepID=A0ABR1HPH9_9HYPO